MIQPDKYSLWIVPQDNSGNQLQQFVDTLADEYHVPRFIPHLTIVANILTSLEDLEDTEKHIASLAASLHSFPITLDQFGYTDEEFRCLFLKAQPSEAVTSAYDSAAAVFPQVREEHFQAMPHMSVLYGLYDAALKDTIIHDYSELTAQPITFPVKSLDLYLTNGPAETWELKKQFPLN